MKTVRSKPQQRSKIVRLIAEGERGQAALIIALAIVGLVGFTALAIDGGNAFFIRRNMQNAADAAVVAGVQGYLAAYDTYGDDADEIEMAIVQQAIAIAEINGVDAGADACDNSDVYIWYIDNNGDVAGSPGTVPTIADPSVVAMTIGASGTLAADCSASSLSSLPSGYAGIEVITERTFDTFLAGVLGREELAAQGDAAAIVLSQTNGCAGDFAAFGIDPTRSSGTLKFTGPGAQDMEIIGDFYAGDDFNAAGTGVIRIDGTIRYTGTTLTISTTLDLWIGPEGEWGDAINGDCSTASMPSDWQYYAKDTLSPFYKAETCLYKTGGYEGPQNVGSISQPFSYDVSDWDRGGEWADQAAGCDTSDLVACPATPVSVGGDANWEQQGDDYYYYTGSGSWKPSGSIANGLYYMPNGSMQVTASANLILSEYVSIVTAADNGDMSFNGTTTVFPATAKWRPYGRDSLGDYDSLEGSGALLLSSFDSGGSTSNAIVMSGVSMPDSEGIIYAPLGDCQISGSQSHSGAMLCLAVDFSGTTGTITFDIAFCPPPVPTISFTK